MVKVLAWFEWCSPRSMAHFVHSSLGVCYLSTSSYCLCGFLISFFLSLNPSLGWTSLKVAENLLVSLKKHRRWGILALVLMRKGIEDALHLSFTWSRHLTPV